MTRRWRNNQFHYTPDRFMCMSSASDFDDVYRYTPEQIECKGCGAPRAHDEPGKCDYCGRPT